MLPRGRVTRKEFPGGLDWTDSSGPPGTYKPYSLSEVLDGHVPEAAFTNKAVPVGDTANTKDSFLASASSKPMSGTEVQANALATILDGYPLKQAVSEVNVILLLSSAFLAALSIRLTTRYVLLVAAGSVALFVLAAQPALTQDGSSRLCIRCLASPSERSHPALSSHFCSVACEHRVAKKRASGFFVTACCFGVNYRWFLAWLCRSGPASRDGARKK
ncbi:MAG: CHASE2 domain-containing protein [Solirubrobacteraceae bacterium]